MMMDNHIISWNCREAKNMELLRSIKELRPAYKSLVLIILETRIGGSDSNKVCKKIGIKGWVHLEARGFSSGVWVLWNDDEINIKVLYTQRHFIHMLVKQSNGQPWEMTAIYASPNHQQRNGIWNELNLIRCRDPWLLIGDFNYTLKDRERSSEEGMSRRLLSGLRKGP